MAANSSGKRTGAVLASGAILSLVIAGSASVACGEADCAESATCAGVGADAHAGGQVDGSVVGDTDADALEHGIRLSIVDPHSPEIVVQGASLALELGVERSPGSQGEIRVEVTGLPKDATSSGVIIAAGSMKGSVSIQTLGTTPQGLMTVTLTATHADDGQRSEVKIELQVRGRSGTLDTTFGDAGVQGTIFASPGLIGTASLQSVLGLPDGRVLVGAQRVNNATVARLSATGKLDTGYGGAGVASLLVSQGFVRLAPMNATTYALAGPGGLTGALFLLDQAGAPVPSFNGTGRRDVDVGPGAYGSHGLASLPDGKALVLSRYQNMAGGTGLGITRWKPDGTLDTTYGADPPGLCSITVAGTGGTMLYPGTMLVAPDGGVRVHAKSNAAGGDGFVKGCTASGAMDTTVGPAPNHVQTGLEFGAATRAPNGDLVVVSETYWRRYNTGGVSDTSIGALGRVALPTDIVGRAALVQADFKVVVGGVQGGSLKVLRYLPNGVLDPDFGDDGVVTLDVSKNDFPADLAALAFQTGGRLLVGGSRSDTADAVVARLWF